ncbi:DUF4440 domain-containing protein [Ensifer sp. 2YAB10]|uniref:nuclear transport factor 2 family protein n=1 Tax=unclassified Ensifer TaxID=2633371 RepID=UPI003F8FFC1C
MTAPLPHLTEIRMHEEALHRPEIRRSRAAVEALLAEGFVEFGASGTVYHRAEIIELLLQEDEADGGKLLTDDYRLTAIAPDAVLLTYRTHRVESDGSERHVLRSSIWKRTGAKWQMLFHQGTVTAPAR